MGESVRIWSIVTALLASTGLLGCSAPTERGWIGGSYRQARAGHQPFLAPPHPQTVRPLPADIAQDQKGAIFVSRVYEHTPVAESGIREGDLIVSVEGVPVTSLARFQKTIDQTSPGTVTRVTTYREGTFQDHLVTVGQEQFSARGQGYAAVGVFIDLTADLWPDPDFNVLGLLGYQHWDQRADLRSSEYALVHRESDREGAGPSTGWAWYLGPIRVSRRRHVVEQIPFSEAGNLSARVD